MKEIWIATDGSSKGTDGGLGGVLYDPIANCEILRFHEAHKNTTNNRMELEAFIYGIRAAVKYSNNIHSILDSKYVLLGITEWMPNWKKKNWKTYSNKPVKNLDLWKIIDELIKGKNISYEWIRSSSKIKNPESHNPVMKEMNRIADEEADFGSEDALNNINVVL